MLEICDLHYSREKKLLRLRFGSKTIKQKFFLAEKKFRAATRIFPVEKHLPLFFVAFFDVFICFQ